MDKLKDPAMILAVTANIGVVGTSAYFYKQLESMRADIIKLSQTVNGLVRKSTEIEKGDQNKAEALYALNDQIKRINQVVDDFSLTEENIGTDLEEIIAVLGENNIQVERPSQAGRRLRSGDRRDRPRRGEEEERSRGDRRSLSRNMDRSRTADMSRSDDMRSSRRSDSFRNDTSRYESSRQTQARTEPQIEYEDTEDLDLIDTVRRQTRN